METIKIEDEIGNVYEFEKPEFECELLKVREGVVYGYAFSIEQRYYYQISWYKSGDVENGYKEESLTPIKPKWYKDENNFPAMCILENKKGNNGFYIFTEYSKGFFMDSDISTFPQTDFRLATKEELLSLYYDGK